MQTISLRVHCYNCQKLTLHLQQKPNYILHLTIAIITVGLWIPFWLLLTIRQPKPQCTKCGASYDGKEALRQIREMKKSGRGKEPIASQEIFKRERQNSLIVVFSGFVLLFIINLFVVGHQDYQKNLDKEYFQINKKDIFIDIENYIDNRRLNEANELIDKYESFSVGEFYKFKNKIEKLEKDTKSYSEATVMTYIQSSAHDPSSVDFQYVHAQKRGDGGWDVQVVFRAKNAFGGLVLDSKNFIVHQGIVITHD